MAALAQVTSAVRTWNKPHTKATVVVTWDDGLVDKFGGTRAHSCQFVIVVNKAAFTHTSPINGHVAEYPAQQWIEGLRAKPVGTVRGNPAISVPVTEEVQS